MRRPPSQRLRRRSASPRLRPTRWRRLRTPAARSKPRRAVIAAGAQVQRGSLDDLESPRTGAEDSDGVIHPAFKHDFSDFAGAGRTERAAAETLGNALEGSDRGVRPVALRFAPTVHGYGDHGFVATLVGVARAKGVAGYVGDGANRWPAVHGVGEQGVQARAIAEVSAAMWMFRSCRSRPRMPPSTSAGSAPSSRSTCRHRARSRRIYWAGRRAVRG